MKERRKAIRFNTHMPARFIYKRGMVAIEEDTFVEDLSVLGARLLLPSIVQKKDIFLIEIKVDPVRRVAAIGEVVWKQGEGKTIIAGALFSWVSDISGLQDYIAVLHAQAA